MLTAATANSLLRASRCVHISTTSLGRPPVALASALSTQLRFQRSVSNRPRASNWRGKVQTYDKQQEEQRMAEEAEARRIARLRGGSGSVAGRASARQRQKKADAAAHSAGSFDFFRGEGATPAAAAGSHDSAQPTASGTHGLGGNAYDSHHDVSSSNPAAVPRFSALQSLRLFRRSSVKSMPLNPLHRLTKTSSVMDKHAANPDAGHVSRFLLAIEELHGRSRKRNEQITAQLSDDQKRDIVARYSETKWWGRMYLPFKNVSDTSVRRMLRIGRGVVAVCMLALMSILLLLYKQELNMISQLSPEDRRDYTHMVMGMRQGDISKLANEVLSKEDPLYALPDAVRCHVLLQEARKRNWHKIDWETESRNLHPDSALVERDYAHLLYWAAMSLGSMVYGGSSVFDDNAFRYAEEERERAHRQPAQQLEPTAKPETRKRSFLS